MTSVITAFAVFVALGALIGLMLAFASKKFYVKTDERIPKVLECLPGANCGGCGYAGCAALAEKIVNGEAKASACSAGGDETAEKIAEILGITAEKADRMRAQVMCSGTAECTAKRANYSGISDCRAAAALGGGDRTCRSGCLGLGTCAAACPFDAITVKDGSAVVDYIKCRGCGVCVDTCPKKIIKLIPYGAYHWIGCSSVSVGKETRDDCEVGCIGCGICAKNCPESAISVTSHHATIDYSKCTNCGICVSKCPRKIIWTGTSCGPDAISIKRV